MMPLPKAGKSASINLALIAIDASTIPIQIIRAAISCIRDGLFLFADLHPLRCVARKCLEHRARQG